MTTQLREALVGPRYISLLDPLDGSRNFERPGREPYIYLSLLRAFPHFDLIRQQVQITNLTLDSGRAGLPAALSE